MKPKSSRPPIDMQPEEFRSVGHRLVDELADFLERIPRLPVTPGQPPSQVRDLIGGDTLPETGLTASEILAQATEILTQNSLLNSHPRFMGYITSSPAPLGTLADFLAASINPNVGAWILSPVASEIEAQTLRWLAEMIGYPRDCGGLLVSGGNMANFVAFLAARANKAPWDIRQDGLHSEQATMLCVYASRETHTWIQKAMDLFGMGTGSIRWVDTDANLRLDVDDLERKIRKDIEHGNAPMMVVGTAGSVATGSIDPLASIAQVCREHDCWFHVDGAYGAFAAVLENVAADLHRLELADSIALDPHKWLYAPLEVGCTLVKNPEHLTRTYSHRPSYYKFDGVAGEHGISFNEYGPQNSRGFRALKVWMGLKQMGRRGYVQRIGEDIRLAERLKDRVLEHPDFEFFSHSLSITTFRYVPRDLTAEAASHLEYLNELNKELLTLLQEGGELFLSNAIVDGRYLLRACIVNFRTSQEDIDTVPEIVARLGSKVDARRRNVKV